MNQPMPPPSEQWDVLLRGVVDCVQQEDLKKRLEKAYQQQRPLRVKLGLDPTAPDIHLGHTVVLRKLRQFQDFGHQAILVIGGATAVLGDPTGKDKMRPSLTAEEVQANAQTYLDQAAKVLDASRLEVVNNGDWFLKFGFQEFIQLSSRMTVARMLERELFQRRMKQGNPIGIHEFLYPLLQGWDSVEIRSDVELGGTDQLFNLLVGRDLQEQADQAPQVCMTMPLLVGLDGEKKMSKSLGNYIGLTFEPQDMFGKVMSIPDALMRTYFLLLTDLDEAEIDRRLAGHPREAKGGLAEIIVTWLHGSAAAAQSREHFNQVFQRKEVPDDIPEIELAEEEASGGAMWIVPLVVRLGFAKSNGEARRLIQGRGVKIDGDVVEDLDRQVDLTGRPLVQVGKRRFARAGWAGSGGSGRDRP